MALILSALQSQLETVWLVPDGGSYPETVRDSGDRFASAVASWFSLAQSNGILCTTAKVRERQLAALVASSFPEDPSTTAQFAAEALAGALSSYITGQQFGPLGLVTSAPLGVSAAVSAFSDIFSNHELLHPARALLLAKACQELALTTLVTFPYPLPTPAPLM